MKARRLAVCYVICVMLLLLLPVYRGNCQNYVEYSIQINGDGSALWKVNSFSDIDATVDPFDSFQTKVLNLVDSAANVTHRGMSVDENSLQINTTILSQSKTTEYSFLWQNFSVIQGGQIVFGDVFQVNGFFSLLYGDAAMQANYPSTFSVESVTPTPYQRNEAAKTLDWSRTQDLVNSKTNVVLTHASLMGNSNQSGWELYAIIVAVAIVGVTLGLGIFYFMKRRRLSQSMKSVIPAVRVELETEEGKVLKLLKSSGVGIRQSVVVDQLGFSKAKTSQLLAALEEKGSITRYKKGRDKIVNLAERVNGE